MIATLSQVEVRDDRDVVPARQRARTIATRLGFESHDQARIATAVSELARDAVAQAGGGRVEFLFEDDAPSLVIRFVGEPTDPADPRAVEAPGLDAARRMMDTFEVETPADGSGVVVTMTKSLPRRVPSASLDVARIAEELASLAPPSPVDELLRQNRDLLRALDDLRTRENELERVNRELEDTNRGVLALYVELDERAASLKRASEMKTHFLSNISHELRTPLSSILSLSRLLLDRVDGELSSEQERQVAFILRAAHDLAEMVNDLLDLARIEAGREVIRPSQVNLVALFGALRGMILPLQPAGSPVALIFDDPSDIPILFTDEAKLSQVVRNFLTNALKFTERGEVRLRAERGDEGTVILLVSDTGIGIDPAQFDLIFEEFGQVDGPLQRRVKGTGLGLPLTRKLAGLIGGRVDVRSRPGVGSTFSATIPIRITEGAGANQTLSSALATGVQEARDA